MQISFRNADQDSSVGITRYGRDGRGIEPRLRARYSAPVQNGRGAHPASCTVGTTSLTGDGSGRSGVITTHPCPAPRLNKGYSYTSSPFLGLHGMLQSKLYLSLLLHFSDRNFKSTRSGADYKAKRKSCPFACHEAIQGYGGTPLSIFNLVITRW